MKFSLKIDFEIDIKFWSTGALNINAHSKSLELEFLCFGIYISKSHEIHET